MSEEKPKKSGLSGIVDGIDRGTAALERVIMATGVILMAINTIANVISRFVFNHSLIFAEELNSIFILLVTFAGLGYAARHGRHIRMSAISDALPQRARKILMIVVTGVTAVLLLILAWYSVQYILNMYAKGRVYPALGFPVYISYLWVPIGLFVAGVQYTLTFIKNLQETEIYLSTDLREADAREQELEL
ncbi:TRAP transporter small permease [Boseongicola aestuarii]|uniref:TRAP transporter small permease protein n=1 Tax=Boseongicola aestuarii TaxID=1470561 RepID=A0A238J4M4_9RHOB|nr:TRAP transporter small permease [Boseongicola aestuarii]SMX25271.1 2,3-diketo-L-gulonate TRAP transporter small permease protein YiaM [Boseongicola aestuarii]